MDSLALDFLSYLYCIIFYLHSHFKYTPGVSWMFENFHASETLLNKRQLLQTIEYFALLYMQVTKTYIVVETLWMMAQL